MKIKEITLIAVLAIILFLQEQLLSILPNIQLTILLIMVYSCTLKMKKTMIIVTIHVILDNIISFNPVFLVFMLIGWLIIPISLNTIFKKIREPLSLAFLSILFAFIYSFTMIIPNLFLYEINLLNYFLMDLPFEIILATSAFITVLWLYKPLIRIINRLLYDN